MFVEPGSASEGHRAALVLRACHREPFCYCAPIRVVLSLAFEGGGENRREYSLMACSRTPAEYVADMYRLYAGGTRGGEGAISESGGLRVEDAGGWRRIDLSVGRGQWTPELHPREWLLGETRSFPCVKAYRHLANGEDASLEIYVARPRNSTRYYALGEERQGTILFVSEADELRLSERTVRMLLKTSSQHCHRPLVCEMDWLAGSVA